MSVSRIFARLGAMTLTLAFVGAVLVPSASQAATSTTAGESSTATSTSASPPPALGTVFHDASGDSAVLIGEPTSDSSAATNSAAASTAAASTAAIPDGCGSGDVCAYEDYDYSTSNWAYAFPERYTPYQDLSGDCYSLDYGDTFNDCTKSDYNAYGSCSYAVFYWNADYGGNTYDQDVGSGTDKLVKNVNQFSSQINCN